MTQQFILVLSAQRRRLVRLSLVQEILSLMALTPVDNASGSCRGLANLRGEIIPVFDSSGPDAVLSPSRFILIAQLQDSPIGVIVDDVQEVLTLTEDQIKVRPVGPGRTAQVVSLGDEILSILDPKEIAQPLQG